MTTLENRMVKYIMVQMMMEVVPAPLLKWPKHLQRQKQLVKDPEEQWYS